MEFINPMTALACFGREICYAVIADSSTFVSAYTKHIQKMCLCGSSALQEKIEVKIKVIKPMAIGLNDHANSANFRQWLIWNF